MATITPYAAPTDSRFIIDRLQRHEQAAEHDHQQQEADHEHSADEDRQAAAEVRRRSRSRPAVKPPTFTADPDAGSSLPRRRLTRSVVALSCALVFGYTCHRYRPSATGTAGEANATLRVGGDAPWSTAASVAVSAFGSSVTRTSGRAEAGAEAVGDQVVRLARGVVWWAGCRCRRSPGGCRAAGRRARTSTAAPATNAGHGRRCTIRLQRHQNCCSLRLVLVRRARRLRRPCSDGRKLSPHDRRAATSTPTQERRGSGW